jgi:chemotaxis protein methyltransferase CheR
VTVPAPREQLLSTVEQALRDACGITLTEGLRATLSDALARASRDTGVDEPTFLGRLRGRDAEALTALVEASVIGETYFFRHPEQFEALQRVLLRDAPREKPISIWSAGCSTGEEAYSLAMALLDAGRAGAGDHILATDVSARALAVAREGVYGEWSMRRLPPELRLRHFHQRGPLVSVRAEARTAVTFDRHNLVRDEAPGSGFDLVVCRNVLIYFTSAAALEVAGRLLGAARPGGLLLLGPVESAIADGLDTERVEVGGATLYRRPTVPRARRRPAAVRGTTRRRAERPAPARRARSSAPRAAAPAMAPAPPSPPAPAPAPQAGFAAALEAARRGDLALAERLAREVAARDLCPESYLLLSMAAEARGDVGGAVEAVRRALYLDPGLAMGHAALVPLYGQLGLAADAARARRNALEAIEGLDDGATLRGVEPVTAGALRSALGGAPTAPAGTWRTEP